MEKHLGLTLFLSVILHVFIGWLFLLVLPDLLEARRQSREDFITVQLLGDLAPPAPAAPADIPVNPEAKGPDVVEAPRSAGERAPQITPPAPDTLAAPADVVPLGPKALEKPPVIKKKATPPPKVTPPKVEKPKPKAPSLDDQIASRLRKVERRVEGREQPPADSNMVNRNIAEGRGQGEGSESGGATGGARVDPRKMAYYRHIRDIVVSNWVTPISYSANSTLDYKLVIQPNGHLSSVEQARSSGDPDLDISLVRAINKSNPFPPLPEVFENRPETIILRFNPDDVRRLQQQ